MKLNCDEASKICDKNQYGEASIWEKIKLTIHLFLCKNCSKYSKQNTIITKCVQTHSHKTNEHLTSKEKEVIEQEILANNRH